MVALRVFADRERSDVDPARLPRLASVRVAGASDPLCPECEIVETTFARMRGLLGRRELPGGHGMLINPSPSVMTWFMHFPIDVVFIDREWRVVRIVDRLRPWRIAGARRAVAALELPGGTAAAFELRVGDVLELKPVPGVSR